MIFKKFYGHLKGIINLKSINNNKNFISVDESYELRIWSLKSKRSLIIINL